MLFIYCFFFFNDTATTEIYTLSLHDALPILSQPISSTSSGIWPTDWQASRSSGTPAARATRPTSPAGLTRPLCVGTWTRSEEHTSELQSPCNLVCRLPLEKKKHLVSSKRQYM